VNLITSEAFGEGTPLELQVGDYTGPARPARSAPLSTLGSTAPMGRASSLNDSA